MNAELRAWLEANGLIGPDGSLNFGDYGNGAPIGNSGLYRRGDESLEDFAARIYQAARGNGEWGTAGRGLSELQNAGFANELAPVTIDGAQYHRVGEDITAPGWMQKFLTGLKPDAARYANQWDLGNIARNDPTYGHLMREPEYQEALRLRDAAKSEGFFADNSPWDAFSKTILRAYGVGAGLNALGEMGFSSLGKIAADAGWQGFGSSLAANAASQGGSLADILNALPFNSPDIPWGVNAREAIPGLDWGRMYEEFGLPQSFNGTLADLRNIIAPASGLVTAAGATALSSGGGSFLSNLFSPSSLLNAGGAIGGALINAGAANRAADKLTDAAGSSNALLRDIYTQNRADLEPWRQAGVNALTRLGKLTAPGSQVSELELDPGYQFRLGEGTKAIERSAASKGLLRSGATLKGITRYGQDYASGEYGNVVNRLLAQAGLGQSATNTGVQAGQNYGNNAANNLLSAGNARASGYVGTANAITGGVNSFLNNYNQQNILNQLLGVR